MRKYTDLQLSRILSVAAVGELGENYAVGYGDNGTVCIEQAAYSDLDNDLDEYPFHRDRGSKWDAVVNNGVAPIEEVAVLSWLEANGMA